jgi:hypothetical protein
MNELPATSRKVNEMVGLRRVRFEKRVRILLPRRFRTDSFQKAFCEFYYDSTSAVGIIDFWRDFLSLSEIDKKFDPRLQTIGQKAHEILIFNDGPMIGVPVAVTPKFFNVIQRMRVIGKSRPACSIGISNSCDAFSSAMKTKNTSNTPPVLLKPQEEVF